MKKILVMAAVALLIGAVTAVFALQTTGGQAYAQSAAPAKPTGLTVTTFSHNSVTLRWSDPDDSSIIGYRILRRDTVNQSPGTFTTVAANTGSTATTYTDTAVAAETRYAYRVKAINSIGLSARSGYANVTTTAAPTPAPTVVPTVVPTSIPTTTPPVPARPTGLAFTSITHGSVSLNWSDPGDSNITGYQVLRRSRDGAEHGDGEGAPEYTAIVDDTGTATTSYTDNTVTPQTRYVYRVKAINPQGTSPRSTYLNVETDVAPTPVPTAAPTAVPTAVVALTLLAAPEGLALSDISFDYVSLAWNDPGEDSITHYKVLRRTGEAGPFTTIAENTGSAALSYTDSTVSADTEYGYRVVAVNADGSSPKSDTVTIRTFPQFTITDPIPPPEPPELVALYGSVAETEPILSTSITAGVTTSGGKTYAGYASGNPVSIGSMTSRTISVQRWNYACEDSKTTCSATITEMYYVRDGSQWYLVVRMGTKMDDDWTLTIDGTSYDVEDAGYMIGRANTYYEQTVGPQGHAWRVRNPNISDGDGLNVNIDRPVPQPQTGSYYPAIVDDPDDYDPIWATIVNVGGETSGRFRYTGYEAGEYGSLTNTDFRYDGQDYTITNFLETIEDGQTHTSFALVASDSHLPDNWEIQILQIRNLPISDSEKEGDNLHLWLGLDPLDWANGDVYTAAIYDLTPTGERVEGRVTVDSGWSDEYHLTLTKDGFRDYIEVPLELGHRYRVSINTEPGNHPRLRHVLNPYGLVFEHGSSWDPPFNGAHMQWITVDLRYPGHRHVGGSYYIRVQGHLAQSIESYRVRVDRQ